jgi:hypothetical protein
MKLCWFLDAATGRHAFEGVKKQVENIKIALTVVRWHREIVFH